MFPVKQGTILVVEDEEQVRTLIVRLLEKKGYAVESAENGRLALEAARDVDNISLVITDMIMPEMGGQALLEALRKERPAIPAICMTGYSREEMADSQKIPDAAFMEKPFTPAMFLDQVAELLKKEEDRSARGDR
jgi:two-component system cell cycle sensor histidine kinase/response regulator CckA